MTYTDRFALVREHFHTIKPQRALLSELVVRRLGGLSATTRRFTTGRETELAGEFAKAMWKVVYGSADLGDWEAPLLALGEHQAARGVRAEHYAIFKGEMLQALADVSGGTWTESHAEAWDSFLHCVCGLLIRGGSRAERVRRAA
ncbi:MAG: globin [Planctomycetota bacterium]